MKTVETNAARPAKKALVKAIQSRARQKYFFLDADALAAYYICTDRIDANRPALEQVSEAIIDKSPPGVPAARKTPLAELRQAYFNANTTKTGAQSDATGARTTLGAMLKGITQRMPIKFATDAEWPSTPPPLPASARNSTRGPGSPSRDDMPNDLLSSSLNCPVRPPFVNTDLPTHISPTNMSPSEAKHRNLVSADSSSASGTGDTLLNLDLKRLQRLPFCGVEYRFVSNS